MTVIERAFVPTALEVELNLLLPSKQLDARTETSQKYSTIEASIKDIGVIEPISVSAADPDSGKRIVLDGHIRLFILRRMGHKTAPCLEALTEEAYTYNSYVNRMSTVQEYYMIRRAIDRGVSSERLAKALNVKVGLLRKKATLLDGICDEAAQLLKDRRFSPEITAILRKMQPGRQIACAELMTSANNLTITYARGLLYTTPESELLDGKKPRVRDRTTKENLAQLEQEAAALQERYKAIEQDYAKNMLDLTVVSGYVAKLIGNPEISRYLKRRYADEHSELKKLVDATTLETTSENAIG